MKSRGRKITITVVATIILGVFAYIFYEDFLYLVLSQFKDANVLFQSTSLTGQSSGLFTFVIVIALLPGLFLFSHFILKDQKPAVFVLIVPITLIFGIAMMSFHIYTIKVELYEMNEILIGTPIKNAMSVSNINAARYLGIGFILGTIFSTAILSFVSRDNHS